MKYDSKIIAHSVSSIGNEILTYEITIPKFILAEINTHKAEIERNSASSRAVPTRTIVDMIREYPVIPVDWRVNARGMQADELMSEEDIKECNQIWLEARDAMLPYVQRLLDKKADKQRVNRLLECWMWTKVVVTFTVGGGIGFNNFMGLRDNDAAQPEFREVARMMHTQYHESTPQERIFHLPYITREDLMEESNHLENTLEQVYINLAIRSSARCGRVTHYKQGQEYTREEDLGRGWSFAENGHFSPLRHASKAGDNAWYGNFYGWRQVSKLILENDYVTKCCTRAK